MIRLHTNVKGRLDTIADNDCKAVSFTSVNFVPSKKTPFHDSTGSKFSGMVGQPDLRWSKKRNSHLKIETYPIIRNKRAQSGLIRVVRGWI